MSNSKYAALAATMEHGSLTRAASALGYTQSGVSHLIRALEQEVGFSLLKRSKSGVELTPEGKRLMPYIQQILTAEKDMQHLCEELRGVSTGQLTVGTFSSAAIAWMPELTRRFAALHPGISLEIYNDTYSPLEEALLREAAARAEQGAEVVLTGREPAAWMQDAADYSTELRAVKHPYTRGIAAREGVEY